MSTPPNPLLTARLVTDAYPIHIHSARERLHTLVLLAGLRLDLGYPDDTPGQERLPLGATDEQTLAALAAHIAPALAREQPAPGIAGAAEMLHAASEHAGLALRPGDPQTRPDGSGRLPLGAVDLATATRLADLLEESCADLLEAADALGAALAAAGVTSEVAAFGGKVRLGEITVPEGAVLLQRLVPGTTIADVDPDDQVTGEDIADRLHAAVKATTGAFLEAIYAPYCRRCSEGPSLLLNTRLSPDHARELACRLNDPA